MGEKQTSSDKLILTHGPLTLGHVRVCQNTFFVFVYTSCPTGDFAITGKCTDSKLRLW